MNGEVLPHKTVVISRQFGQGISQDGEPTHGRAHMIHSHFTLTDNLASPVHLLLDSWGSRFKAVTQTLV